MTTVLAPPVQSDDGIWLDGIIQRVRDYDASRPRSLQQEPGWSEVGGCRAKLGFKLSGAWATDEPDSWAATRGTAIHKLLEAVLSGEPGFRIELKTRYRGIPGHADLVVVTNSSVRDWKTTKLSNSRLWRSKPETMWPKRVQTHGYAAGLIDAGELPEDCDVGLVAIPVDGTYSDWWSWKEPFDRAIADWGADREEWVKGQLADGVLPEALPKDEHYSYCSEWCEYFRLCRTPGDAGGEEITSPDLVAAISRFGEINAALSPLIKEKEGLDAMIRGLRGFAGDWRISLGKGGDDQKVPDEDAIRADYAARGEKMPVTTKAGTRPRLIVTRIKKAARR